MDGILESEFTLEEEMIIKEALRTTTKAIVQELNEYADIVKMLKVGIITKAAEGIADRQDTDSICKIYKILTVINQLESILVSWRI